jgi:hypothetical protein
MNALFSTIFAAADSASQADKTDWFYQFYASNLRASLFSGFLTLTGFLFAVKTFFILNLKKELYDRDGYLRRIRDGRALNPKLTVFGPLKRLSRFLLCAVGLSLIASVSQMTLGLAPFWWAAVICLVAATAAVVALTSVLCLVSANLKDWFQFMEDEANAKVTALPGPGSGPTQSAPS